METKGLVKVTRSHLHCKSGNISEIMQDRDVVTTLLLIVIDIGLSNSAISEYLN